MAKNTYTCDKCNFRHTNPSTFFSHLHKAHDMSYKDARLYAKELLRFQYRKMIDIENPIFLDNKYTKWYYQIIRNARQKTYDCYTEDHHILPRSLDGADIQENIITVSAKEHFMLHLLLTKMLEKNNPYYYKMFRAFFGMQNNHTSKNRYTSRMFDILRSKRRNAPTKRPGKILISNIELDSSMLVPKEELQQRLDTGWKRGRLKKKGNLKKSSKFPTKYENLRIKNNLPHCIESIKDKSIVLNVGPGLKITGFNFLAEDIEQEISRYSKVMESILIEHDYSIDNVAKSFSINYRTIRTIARQFGINLMSRSNVFEQKVKNENDESNKRKRYKGLSQFRFDIHSETKVENYHLVKNKTLKQIQDEKYYRLKLYSVKDGCENDVPVSILAHPANCIYTKDKNFAKNKSMITYEELLRRISLWETSETIDLNLAPKAIKENTNMPDNITCPHCGKSGYKTAMKRWHFDNCKEK